MKCTRVKKFLPLHVAGDLRGRRARPVIKHLTTCAACRHAAVEYDASRQLLRAGAESLPAEFDSAFYEEIRNSVLAQIKQSRTFAPPPFAPFSAFFNGRLAYAASLALIVMAAALALHSFLNHTSENDRRQKRVIAKANDTLNVPPAVATPTPRATQAGTNGRQTSRMSVDFTGWTTGKGASGGAESQRAKREAPVDSVPSGEQRSLMSTKHTPSHTRRNPLAPNTGRTRQATKPPEVVATGGHNIISSDGAETTALAEVSRIEIQTSDPNIRIIWLTPGTDSAQPLK